VKRADVVVVGGGPAGTTLAASLASSGAEVIVLEKSRYRDWRPGETLAPVAAHHLGELGLREALADALPLEGIASRWETEMPQEQSYIANPYGHGWALDRPAFDAGLASLCQDRGAGFAAAARVRSLRRSSGSWEIVVDVDGREAEFRAGFVVDAAGGSGALARHVGAHWRCDDNLLCISAEFSNVDTVPELWIEATANGWWYSCPLRGRRAVLTLITDGKALSGSTALRFWNEELDRSVLTSRRSLASPSAQSELRVCVVPSGVRDPIAAEGWLAVGDAAFAADPLSGTGIPKAIELTNAASHAVLRALDGDPQPAREHADSIGAAFDRYTTERSMVYERQQRIGGPFWERRAAT
jgi:flavin-dependent dehydrogenase